VAEVVYLNGRFVPMAEALVPVEDRGMLFADGIYEVVRSYGGRVFALEAHLERLERSAAAIRLALPPRDEVRRVIEESLQRLAEPEATVYLQVTRGHPGARDHAVPKGVRPTVFAIARPAHALDPKLVAAGVDAITLPDRRWQMCHVKSIGLLLNSLARQDAIDAGAFDAILVRDGVVTEGSATNVCCVFDGALVTHPEGPLILSGVTRATVLRLARDIGLPVREEPVPVERLGFADEVFFCGTTTEVLGVRSIDGRTVGSGRPGPVTTRLHAVYAKAVGADS
jgi:D-alanine transaminase